MLKDLTTNGRGSVWHRWDPHIHTPGTALNDQYRGPDPWGAFLTSVESASPTIRALGVTDYFSIDNYVAVRDWKARDRLADVALIFPNVEMRLGFATSAEAALNLHLLFSPDDPNHVDEIRRFLSELEFTYLTRRYRCQRDELIKLARAHTSSLDDDEVALRHGANLFKVNFDELRDRWHKNPWASENSLVAVSGGETDGTSGLRDASGSWDATRKSIEAFAHIIFSATPKQREFWLGHGREPLASLRATWNGPKACLHGSDAHSIKRVGAPDLDRYCWLKGDLTFDTLKQACMEPEDRVAIGPEAARGPHAGQTITAIDVAAAPWFAPARIELNAGLIAVIGARGSGKTALADLIAVGSYAMSGQLRPNSFVHRARDLLGSSRVELTWGQGDATQNDLRYATVDELIDTPRVQYLSQEFVSELCSSEGLADPLVEEIQRVIFNALPVTERMSTSTFAELLALRSKMALERRRRHEQRLVAIAKELNDERALKHSLGTLQRQRTEKLALIAKDKKDRQALVAKGQEERARRHEQVSEAADKRRQGVEALQRQQMAIEGLKEDVRDLRERQGPEWLASLKEGRKDAGLSSPEWDALALEFAGDADGLLQRHTLLVSKRLRQAAGPAEGEAGLPDNGDWATPLISANKPLDQQTLSLLEKELLRLSKLIGVDTQNAKRYADLSAKIAKEETALGKLNEQIQKGTSADTRIDELRQRRRDTYKEVFAAIETQEAELARLYAPLKRRLEAETGSLGLLSFSVHRVVDIQGWVAAGEALLDLRKSGPFKGQGTLLASARHLLLPAWQSGNPEVVASAMEEFLRVNEQNIRDHRLETRPVLDWWRDIALWLHDTDHITVAYNLQYEGLNIESLSQGTRGIVLLLLYLAIDVDDDRPLMIDQPEENLDPKSIFDELVGRFRKTKLRRQIIIVTHNANLVVNTDADQVIVAKCGPRRADELPRMTYLSGGLENPAIRREVCDILEGGEEAFKERAKRLRVRL